MKIDIKTENGQVLDVPVLCASPVVFELEVAKKVELEEGRVYLCKIRNVLADESLCDSGKPVEELVREVAPVLSTCNTYFAWNGTKIGGWGELKDNIKTI